MIAVDEGIPREIPIKSLKCYKVRKYEMVSTKTSQTAQNPGETFPDTQNPEASKYKIYPKKFVCSVVKIMEK